MAIGGAGLGRAIAAPLLALTVAMAARMLDRTMSGAVAAGRSGPLDGFEGNGATPYLILFSLIAGVLIIGATVSSIHHLRLWSAASGAGAQATAWVAWLFVAVAFCLAWKEIHLSRHRGVKLRVLEAFVIMLTPTHLVYILTLYLGGADKSQQQRDAAGVAETGTGSVHRPKPLNHNSPSAV